MRLQNLFGALIVLVMTACGDTKAMRAVRVEAEPDAGEVFSADSSVPDASIDVDVDAGVDMPIDAGVLPDDAGVEPVDAGMAVDAGPVFEISELRVWRATSLEVRTSFVSANAVETEICYRFGSDGVFDRCQSSQQRIVGNQYDFDTTSWSRPGTSIWLRLTIHNEWGQFSQVYEIPQIPLEVVGTVVGTHLSWDILDDSSAESYDYVSIGCTKAGEFHYRLYQSFYPNRAATDTRPAGGEAEVDFYTDFSSGDQLRCYLTSENYVVADPFHGFTYSGDFSATVP